MTIGSVLVMGAGTMGRQVALWCAANGLRVACVDPSERALETAQEVNEQTAAEQGFDLAYPIEYALVPAGHTDVDLVIECIVETLRAKHALFTLLDQMCPERTIFVTNTSELLASEVSQKGVREDRFAALHFYPPLWRSRMCDLQPAKKTTAGTLEELKQFISTIDHEYVQPRKEVRGYVFNALYNVLNHRAISLVANDVCSIEDVDRSWRRITGSTWGIFEALDGVGLDTVLAITRNASKRMPVSRQLRRNVRFLEDYVAKGWLGKKSGRGFYDYS